jgi:hypothetical protein
LFSGSATSAVAAHGFPLKCWKLAATVKPIRGTSRLPIQLLPLPLRTRVQALFGGARLGELAHLHPLFVIQERPRA